jgi:peptidyl-prolyl cis-trans isomerase C
MSMPYLVNGQLVTEDRVREEELRLSQNPQWLGIIDKAERARQLRTAAQFAAIDVTLLNQIATSDPRPVDPVALERELHNQRATGNCSSVNEEHRMRQWIEGQFRLQRTVHEMGAGARPPAPEEIEAFYQAHRENFRGSAMFRAAHIVKHTDGGQNEDQARAGIEEALAELKAGAGFSEVAERHSDCKGNGGDLGEFVAGSMVQEFEDAIRNLKPGQRTDIFRTQFGFHIAELRGKTPAGLVSFEEVREDIRRVLKVMRQHQEYGRGIAALRSRADIRWIPETGPPEENHDAKQANAAPGRA